MRSYFINLFNYDRFANQSILETIIKANDPEKPVQLMAHLLAAQQVWLARCKGETATGVMVMLWPDWKAYKLEQLINDNHNAWLNYLEGLNEGDFDSMISYKSFNGDSHESKLSDMLTQVTNHGTHHRAQAGQHLKLAGAELPTTDYIFYTRMR